MADRGVDAGWFPPPVQRRDLCLFPPPKRYSFRPGRKVGGFFPIAGSRGSFLFVARIGARVDARALALPLSWRARPAMAAARSCFDGTISAVIPFFLSGTDV